jgi:small subunit ribosomal protein S9
MPLPKAATHQLGPIPSYWRTVGDMDQLIGKGIRETQYRRLIAVLGQLNRLKRIAELGGAKDIAKSIQEVIGPFERPNKDVLQTRKSGRHKPVPDEYGRAYALGRRKTSSARVWVIPIQPSTQLDAQDTGIVPTSQILVNGISLARYFTHVTDRERAYRPLKLTGTLSAYNVFALVRGGGTMAQAEAIALGVSKALQVLEPSVSDILKQGLFMLYVGSEITAC